MENLENKSKEQLLHEVETLRNKVLELEKHKNGELLSDKTYKESDVKYRNFFENNDAIILFVNPDNGNITFANNAATKFYGYSKKQLEDLTVNHINTLSPEEIETKIAAARLKKQNYFILKHKLANGKIRDVEVYQSKLQLNDQDIFSLIVHDITDRKLAEIETENKEKQFRTIVESAGDAMFLADYETKIIIFANVQASKALGYTHEELLKLKVNELDPVYISEEEIEKLWSTLKVNEPITFETKHKRKDGSVFPIEVRTGLIIYDERKTILGFARDISDRKLAEEKLLLSDERYRLASTASDNGIWDWWIESNKVFFSDQWKAQLGYKPDEIANEFKSWEDLLHPDDKDQTIQKVMDFLASPSEYFRAEFRMRHKDDSYRWINNKASAVLDEDGKVNRMFGAHTDISDYKNAEKKIIEEKNKAQQYLDIADVMLVSINSSGNVELINPKGCEILGYSEEEIYGKNWFDNFLPERLREDIKKVSAKIYSGEMESVKYYENEILTKSGNERLIAWHTSVIEDDNGKIINVLSSGEDITERKLAEDKLQESLKSEQSLANMVRTAPISIAFGYPDGSLENCNRAFSELTGYSEEELKTINWNEVLTPEKWNAIEAEELKKLNLENSSIRYEKEYIHKNGNIIPIELVVTAKFDNENNLLHFTGFITDITERKQAEEEITKHREHLEELVKERTQEVDEKNKKLSDQMKIFVGREIKIRDLEAKIKVLQGK